MLPNIDVLVALVAALLGGGLTIAGAWAQASYYRRQRRKALSSALASEIASIVGMARQNAYVAVLRNFADAYCAPDFEGIPRHYTVPTTQSYFCVFEANAGDIGELSAGLSADVVTFYQSVKVWLELVSPANASELGTLSPREHGEVLIAIADQLEKIMAFGEGLVGQLVGPGVKQEIEAEVEQLGIDWSELPSRQPGARA